MGAARLARPCATARGMFTSQHLPAVLFMWRLTRTGWSRDIVGQPATINNNTIAQVPMPCTIPIPCASNVRINIQGFVYWDPEGQWEIHPFTAWELATGGSNGGSNGGSGGSNNGSGGSNGACSFCLGLPPLSFSFWLLILGGSVGLLGSLGLVTARARAKLRHAKERLRKNETPRLNG